MYVECRCFWLHIILTFWIQVQSHRLSLPLQYMANLIDAILTLTPCWSVLDIWKINLEKLSSMNWIFSLFQTWFLLPVYPAKINFEIDFCRLKIQFVELDFSKIKYRSTWGNCPRTQIKFNLSKSSGEEKGKNLVYLHAHCTRCRHKVRS
jgi:hypothetical protein